MMKSAIQFVFGTTLVLATAAASAASVTKPLTVAAIIQERAGPAARCPSKFGGTIIGHADRALLGRAGRSPPWAGKPLPWRSQQKAGKCRLFVT